ncbi:hypothetical protein BVX93_01835 [bacterium B13(2017)]|nr:hypothetical protein BVX93_01835 [bacterium B13(2017)]
MKIFINFILCLLISLSLFSADDISKEKMDLIQKILELNNVKSMAEGNMKMVISSINHDMDYFIEELSQEIKIPLDQMDKIKKESYERIKAMYNGLHPKEINAEEIYLSTFSKLYDKYFAHDELVKIIDFFESPIGKKYLDNSITLEQEAIKSISEKISPQISKLVNKLFDEEKSFLKKIYPSN